ncbi:MAG: glutamate--tRNA ligase [Candidatus Methanomethylicota archaeon]|uniref:Glutamate--tRNA ligase n=1 Tax=Thermoproteota archaeon TaxID=2056631 RepID=A0A497EUZ6_9CREN|nr:MAG: glutamate--tRNA ligase [Candidatus Verstraetearchaeota archaeon]
MDNVNSILSPDIELLIKKHALLNAYRHKGKAELKPVISKVIGERPDLKSMIKQLIPHVKRIVNEVNSMSLDDQLKLIQLNWPELLISEKKVEEKGLPPLPNVDRFNVVRTRFAPNPDAPLHLGSARPIILCHEYARMYKGKFILRFEDTDPKTKRPILEVYDWIKEDLLWLNAKWDEEYIQSDRMLIYYKYAEKLLEMGAAYACNCPRDVFSKYKNLGKPCPCRSRSPEENLELWDKMLNGELGEGEVVIRIKTDMAHPNPAIRDWVAFRIIDIEKYPHPRVGSKYWVWPTYNFACAIDDHEMRISHILRGKEHISNTFKQKYVFEYLGWEYPEAIHFGRLKLSGWILSKSKIAEGIRKGIYKSWDDPRLGTLKALRRRGFLPEAIREIILQVGIKPVESSISLENLYSINRRLIEPMANRFFFIDTPITLKIINSPSSLKAKIPFHPSYPERGFKEFNISVVNGTAEVLISKEDLNLIEPGKIIRLMGLLNFKVKKVREDLVVAEFDSLDHKALPPKSPIIHWLPKDVHLNAIVVMPDASEIKGLCEIYCKELRVDDRIQFVRFGFVRVDEIGDPIIFYYTHP